MAQVKLKELSISDLFFYEKAASKVCSRLENENNIERFQNHEINEKYNAYNKQYIKIIDEMERRVKDLV